MSTRAERVAYRASWRNAFFANIQKKTFSTPTGDYAQNAPPSVCLAVSDTIPTHAVQGEVLVITSKELNPETLKP